MWLRMNILVTGAGGFIGSHLCERLLANSKHQVYGVDTFIGPTPNNLKQHNLIYLKKHPRFTLIKDHLLNVDLRKLLNGIDVVYHLAAIPGVRSSWGKDFNPYVENNIVVTQQLLEACKDIKLEKFIYASTSSIYGEKTGKVSEDMIPHPLSPYGATKLTGEHLCHLYQKSYGIPIVILRYFTVYGPRQRPDMAFHRFIKQMTFDEPITVFGDGKQTRDFTYIDDCIDGTSAVLTANNVIGETINIGGKERSSVLEIISLLEQITSKKAKITFSPKVKGEPRHTWADISKANHLLSYYPVTTLSEGLKKEYQYFQSIYEEGST